MIRKKLGGAFAALAFSGLMATTALAGCAEDIKNVETRKEDMNIRNEGGVKAVENMIARAKEALADGNLEKCANLVKKANAKVDSAH